MLPKRAFITFVNEKYVPLVDRLIESIRLFSKYKIIVYSYNFEYNSDKANVINIKINDELLHDPKFEMVDENFLGIVDRSDFNTYYTLSRKPYVIYHALQNGLEEGIFLDADGLVKENIDDSFNHLDECGDYPLIGKGLFEYMTLYGKGNPWVGDALEMPLMNLLGVNERSMHYVQTNFILFNKNCVDFFKECVVVSNNKNILQHNLLYAPYHDETIINVLLWKKNAKTSLPLTHYNLSNFQSMIHFYETLETDCYVNDSDWHFIPKNKDDIKFFHGCKSIHDLDECLNYFKKRMGISYNIIKNDQSFKDKKIAIVTLFDHNYTELAKMSIKNKIEYANKHNYDLIYFDDVIDKSRPPQWSKVKAIESVLSNYDWVWWIDIDALIMEFDIMLESIIDENYDIIFTSNKYSYLSNGSSFFKNTKNTFDFLKDCYDLKLDCVKDINVHTFDHEQQSMRQLLLHEERYKSKIKLIDERACNSFCTTTDPSVLSAYPNWNEELNIYKPNDFVIQFCGRSFSEREEDFKKYEDLVNFGNKNIIIIDCYATTDSKLDILRESIKRLKQINDHILLVAHCAIPEDILKSVEYFIYDKDNIPNEKNVYLNWYNVKNNYEVHITSGPQNPSYGHEYPILKSMKNAFNLAKILGYKNFCFVEFDNFFDRSEIFKIKKIRSDLLFFDKKLSFFKVIYENKYAYETIFFLGDVNYITNKFNNIDIFPNDIKEFNKKFTWIYPFSLEHIFADVFENDKHNILFLHQHFIDFFKNDVKNLSSYVDCGCHILSDQYNNHFIVVYNKNKINVRVTISRDSTNIFEFNIEDDVIPVYKLIEEGVYDISFFDEKDILIKSEKIQFDFKQKEFYKQSGYLIIK
jgi:hypothetical protein